MHPGGLLRAFALCVPIYGGLFAVAKGAGEKALRLISDLRRAGCLLVKPQKVCLLTPVGLAVFLLGTIRRRRLEGYLGRLGICTATGDVSKYYHRLRMPSAWSYLFAMPSVKLGSVRSWPRDLLIVWGANASCKPQDLLQIPLLDERVDPATLPDSTIVYPFPATLPMGLPDSVLIGQAGHEEGVVTPALDCLFRDGDQLGRSLRDDEVVGACIVDDLNLVVVFGEGAQAQAAAAVNNVLRSADALCDEAGLPSQVSKAKWASQLGRKVAGVLVEAQRLQLQMPEQRLQDLVTVTYSLCCACFVKIRLLDKIVSMWTWYALLRRRALSIFHEAYAWVRTYRDSGYEFAALSASVASELLCMAALAPLWVCKLDANTSLEVFAYDASLWGGGVVSCVLPSDIVVRQLEKAEIKGSCHILESAHGITEALSLDSNMFDFGCFRMMRMNLWWRHMTPTCKTLSILRHGAQILCTAGPVLPTSTCSSV